MPHLADPRAVAAVHRSEPLDTPSEPSLDRLTRLAARTLGVPATLVSVADEEEHRVRSVHGLPPLPARALPPSACRLVAASGAPLLVRDVRTHPELRELSTVVEREVMAFAGVPLVDADGKLLGTLCALDWSPRAWSAEDEELLGDLATALARELAGARHERGVGEQRTRELVDGLDAIVWECDPRTFLFTFVNRRAEEMLGYPLEQWYTDPMLWVGMIHPDDREHTVLYCQVETRERRDHTFEYRVLTADGRVLWLRDVVKLVLDEDGEPWRLRGVMLDITERKRAETERDELAAALQRSEARLREAQRIAHIGSWEWEVATDALTWSDEMFALAGRAPGAAPSRQEIVQLCHPEDLPHVLREAGDAVRNERAWSAEFRLALPDGGMRRLLAFGRPVHDANGGAVVRWVGTMQDVTEQRELELQLRHAQKMEAVGQLAGGVAHDFNNLLAAVLANTELLLADLPADSPSREEGEEIRAAAQRAAALTRQLLAFGRKQVLYPRVLDLNGVVRGLARMLERLIVDDVTLHLDLAPALDSVSADPGQLEQVLMNLALNARDAMPYGGVLTVRTCPVTVPDGPAAATPLPPGRYVALEVCDEGVGMDAATLARAFEPFFTTKRPGAGTGLGLATVHGIVRQSGGDVRIESRPRHGTTVTVLLPAARQPAQAEASGESSVAVRGGRTVLLVDDDEAVRRSLERMLIRFGYQVLAAADAESALRVAAGHDDRIDVLLTDIVMPGLSGPALAERLAALRPETRVLFISGYEEVARAQTGLAHGAPLLRKPFAGAALAERLKALLEQ